jgi:hypothetical protein
VKTMTIEEALEIIVFFVLEKTYAVPAGLRGRIARIRVREGNLVEYGEPLFLVCVEKTKKGGSRP